MPRIPSEGVGLKGQSVKAEWIGEALEAEHDRIFSDMPNVPGLPKPKFVRPWASIDQAPSEENLNDAAYGGSA